jgi:hypothetical protein
VKGNFHARFLGGCGRVNRPHLPGTPHHTMRSIELFGITQQSSEKFDYFVCGVAGALFAYIGEHYTPQRFEIGISLLDPSALLFLAGAFFVGLKQIETVIVMRRINFKIVDSSERAGNMTKALSGGTGGPYYNEEGGEILTLADVHRIRQERIQEREALQPKLQEATLKAQRLYKVRDWLLILGFLCVFASKILKPYA